MVSVLVQLEGDTGVRGGREKEADARNVEAVHVVEGDNGGRWGLLAGAGISARRRWAGATVRRVPDGIGVQ